MQLHTAQWDAVRGWSRPLPPGDGPHTLVMAYAGSAQLDDPGPLRDVVAAYPTSCVIGCSSAGEIFGDTVGDDTLTVAVAHFGSTQITLKHERVLDPTHSHAAGLSLGKRLRSGQPELRAAFVLSDGLRVNGSELVSGLVEGTEPGVLISGGLAADGDRFRRTWVLVDGVPRSGFVTAVGLSGPDLIVGNGSRGGWDIFGPQRRITRSENNILFELDGHPALALYKRYLGDRAAGLPATGLLFPLAVRVPGAADRQVVRTILAVDEQAQSMTFAGDVPQGSLAQLMRASFDRLVDGAYDATVAARAALTTDEPTLAVAVSCVGRRLLLGGRTEDELEAVVSGLPAHAELVGFYSYGEISTTTAGACDLHNQTMTMTTIAEHN